ncbi:MAG: hypothetical protein LBN04_11190 [Oscillospiraceae bacterium]|jgi:hypothetical protein|nr:hypothetical protein [Oscillospiraceae bacterium]
MNLSKSIDFLLVNAGAVIQYRLHKEILHDLTLIEEENLLEKVYQTPNFQLVQSYAKPNGYIGSGAHSWDNWRGVKLHETPLQDGECAARLLSNYAIAKTHPLVVNFVAAIRDEEILRQEFSYIPPEIPRFETRFIGTNCGSSLMALFYTIQSLLGYGDDYEDTREFQQTSLKGFERALTLNSLDEMTKRNVRTKQTHVYIEPDELYPSSMSLTTLAYTNAWRTPERVEMLARGLNHVNTIAGDAFSVKYKNSYVGPLWQLVRTFQTWTQDDPDTVMYRRPLTEMAMCGIGERVDVLRESAANLREALSVDGILRIGFDSAYRKRVYMSIQYPTSYVDPPLEPDRRRKWAVECELTFWAVQFLKLMEGNRDG